MSGPTEPLLLWTLFIILIWCLLRRKRPHD
jgi:hypothetical protein